MIGVCIKKNQGIAAGKENSTGFHLNLRVTHAMQQRAEAVALV
jgi:hypothetical protein